LDQQIQPVLNITSKSATQQKGTAKSLKIQNLNENFFRQANPFIRKITKILFFAALAVALISIVGIVLLVSSMPNFSGQSHLNL
jgi:hypothetical protein